MQELIDKLTFKPGDELSSEQVYAMQEAIKALYCGQHITVRKPLLKGDGQGGLRLGINLKHQPGGGRPSEFWQIKLSSENDSTFVEIINPGTVKTGHDDNTAHEIIGISDKLEFDSDSVGKYLFLEFRPPSEEGDLEIELKLDTWETYPSPFTIVEEEVGEDFFEEMEKMVFPLWELAQKSDERKGKVSGEVKFIKRAFNCYRLKRTLWENMESGNRFTIYELESSTMGAYQKEEEEEEGE